MKPLSDGDSFVLQPHGPRAGCGRSLRRSSPEAVSVFPGQGEDAHGAPSTPPESGPMASTAFHKPGPKPPKPRSALPERHHGKAAVPVEFENELPFHSEADAWRVCDGNRSPPELVQNARLHRPIALHIPLPNYRNQFIPHRHADPPHLIRPRHSIAGSKSDEATDQHQGAIQARQCVSLPDCRAITWLGVTEKSPLRVFFRRWRAMGA